MLPGQSANDPTLSSLPAYIDIVGVVSGLDGETLTAVLHLRDIPEDMAFNREAVEDMHFEYMWTFGIDIEGDTMVASNQTEYTLPLFTSQEGNWQTHQPHPSIQKCSSNHVVENNYYPKRTKPTG